MIMALPYTIPKTCSWVRFGLRWMMANESILGEKCPTIDIRLHMSSSTRLAAALLLPSPRACFVTERQMTFRNA